MIMFDGWGKEGNEAYGIKRPDVFKRRKKRPQAAMQQASRKKNRGIK